MPDEMQLNIPSLDIVNQNINALVLQLSALNQAIQDGTGLIWQPYNSLLTSISALSATLVQGDLMFGSGAGTVARLAPGTAGQFLKTQGAAANPVWAAAGLLNIQPFTVSGTYTPTTNTRKAIGFVTGGGGGGGGVATNNGATGGGGGAGATAIVILTISGNLTVTVGAAGVAGANTGGTGGTGGQSALGTTTADGGLGGVGSTAATGTVTAGAGATATANATLAISGGDGGESVSAANGGQGGGSFWGGGPRGRASAPGIDGGAWGTGGGGALRTGGSDGLGGAGQKGTVLVLEFS